MADRGEYGGPNWPCANCSHPRRTHIANPDAPGCTQGCIHVGCECPRYVAHKDIWSTGPREGFHCRLCGEEAVYVCLMDNGCACHPEDRVQLLCAQHAHESEPLGSFRSWPIMSGTCQNVTDEMVTAGAEALYSIPMSAGRKQKLARRVLELGLGVGRGE